MSIDQLTQEALSLPNDLRFQLVEALLASFEDGIDTDIQSEWLLDAQKRRDEIRTGSVQPIPGEDALAQVREILN
ncbi:MAG: addiction module protein [Cyanobacteria bacterium P01_H01_bin.26]